MKDFDYKVLVISRFPYCAAITDSVVCRISRRL